MISSVRLHGCTGYVRLSPGPCRTLAAGAGLDWPVPRISLVAKPSPTQRSLAHLRKQGYLVAVVERWNPHAGVRQDLFGVIDLLALKPGAILGVQTTSGDNLAARRTKALCEPKLRAWFEAGGRFVLHGWRKAGARGKRKLWAVREEELALADWLAAPKVETEDQEGICPVEAA